MPSIDDKREEAASFQQGLSESGIGTAPSDIEALVKTITFEGNLTALIACVCEKAVLYGSPSHADPGQAPHPGVQAAIAAYADWKRIKEGSMDMKVHLHSGAAERPTGEPEILPLSLAGKWVAWSSDGMRIVAAADTIDEAERLAAEADEPEPILERHPGRARL